jgi:hypothetical protein
MDIETLIKDGVRLSKPCIYLTASGAGSEVQAIWGGTGVGAPPEAGGWKHWVSVSCSGLQSLGFHSEGCFSIYENKSEWIAVVDPSAHLPQSIFSGIPLFGTLMMSFPPLDALCLYGNSEIEEWLKSQGLSRCDADALDKTELGDAYERKYQEQSPLYARNADAVLGGWHMRWPEDEAYDENKDSLLLWTFRDAEPWIEVWLNNGQLNVKARIT